LDMNPTPASRILCAFFIFLPVIFANFHNFGGKGKIQKL